MVARLNRELPMPPGYRLGLGGQAEARSRLRRPGRGGDGGGVRHPGVLVLEFQEFKTALVVAGIIPFGLFGAVRGAVDHPATR